MYERYLLDCAVEAGELTALEYVVLMTSEKGFQVLSQLVDNRLAHQPHLLQNTARGIFAKSSFLERCGYCIRTLPMLSDAMNLFSEYAQERVRVVLQQDTGAFVQARLLDLDSPPPKVRDRFIERDSDINEATVQSVLRHEAAGLMSRWTEDLVRIQAAVDWVLAGNQDLLLKLPGFSGELDAELDVNEQLLVTQGRRAAASKQAQLTRALRTKARAAIKKATQLFEQFGKQETLQLFVSGAEISLAHPDSPLKFVVRPSDASPGWLEQRTVKTYSHTPYDLLLLTKEDVYLSRLCVFFPDTPVLDQLFALSMFVESGEEKRILTTANWFGTEKLSEEHKALLVATYPDLKKKFSPDTKAPNGVWNMVEMLERAHPELAHWRPYAGPVHEWTKTWMSPVRDSVNLLKETLTTVREALPAPVQAHLDIA
ncbi:hypothetical protein LC612_39580 [Nostoc sp. CHAB 5834]|nr:hypothetical protein [Nostoc sp. CHAB 5834]